jgi:HTH-type transcriptional regulator/antitoxin HigA
MELFKAEREAAEIFPPGEFIKDELEARGWSQVDLAEILGRHPNQVNKIIQGTQAITPETAKQLADAFGTSAQLWLNLESAYQLSQITVDTNAVARRAKLFDTFPVREILRRGWVETSENISVLEKRFLDFFDIKSLDERPTFAHAARRPPTAQDYSAMWAWLRRARQLAPAINAGKFSNTSLKEAFDRLRLLIHDIEEARHVPRILSEAGIRLVIVETLPRTKMDGATFWLNRWSPVVVLSLRYDRIDGFWHTLLHELDHVKNREGMVEPVVDSDLVGENMQPFADKPEVEKRADRFACEFSIKKGELDNFIARSRPMYSKQRIYLFARRLHVHPGIVVGQLQFRGVIDYKHNREMLDKVRHVVTASALTDGWGNTPPV